MLLGVVHGQGASPRTTEHVPCVDPQLLPESFHVRHQVSRRVVRDFPGRGGPTAAALVEKDSPEPIRGEEAPVGDAASGPRTTMDEQDGQTVRCPALLVVKGVQVVDLQLAGTVRLDLRVEMFVGHGCSALRFPTFFP